MRLRHRAAQRVSWSQLGSPREETEVEVADLGVVGITAKDVGRAQERGGDPLFELIDCTAVMDPMPVYRLGRIIPGRPEQAKLAVVIQSGQVPDHRSNIRPEQVGRVFVSSTYEDLVSHRDAVIQALTRLGVEVRGMESFGARPDPPKDVCLAEVRDCDVYIGILGTRYGSIDPETGKSMTHLEYEEALEHNLDIRIYIPDPDRQIAARYVDDSELAVRLGEFKRLLRSRHTHATYTTAEDLADRVCCDLLRNERPENAKQPTATAVPSPFAVSSVPGAEDQTWYAVQGSDTGREPCTWVHCLFRVSNVGAAVASIVNVAVSVEDPSGKPVVTRVVPLSMNVSFGRSQGGSVTVNTSAVRPGAVRVERPGQIIAVQPGVPVDVEIVTRADVEFEHGTRPFTVTAICTDNAGHDTMWSAAARHL